MEKIRILSTKSLENNLKNLFNKKQFDLHEHDFINIDFTNFDIPQHFQSWIFSSKNSVESIFSKEISPKTLFSKIYCVGENTKSLIEKYGQKVNKMCHNSSELSNHILKHSSKEKFLFCRGNIQNQSFTNFFKQKNIDLNELVVYMNKSNPKKLKEKFEAIMFFSPSGIKSFLEKNSLGNSICVCIGQTTAEFAEKHTSKVIYCNTPSIKNVINKTIKLFNNE